MTDFDYTPRTKREALLMRRAYAMGWMGQLPDGSIAKHRDDDAARIFPIPTRTVTRPREVEDLTRARVFRLSNDVLQWKHMGDAEWKPFWADTSAARAVRDVYANPTETVEVEVEE